MRGKVRIIGGRWRGKRIGVANLGALRPTPDRVRETLFNWLATEVTGRRCLDLFAGTGLLALEALSRGAAEATCVEHDGRLCRNLVRTGREMSIGPGVLRVERADAIAWLERNETTSDLIFLDPPFSSNLLHRACGLLQSRLPHGALVYLESARELNAQQLPWRLIHQQRAGAVHYSLAVV